LTSTVTPITITILVEGACPLTAQYELAIDKGDAHITLSNISQTYDATAKSLTIITDPPGLATNVTYNNLSTLPVDAGTYEVIVTIDDEDYVGTITGTLEIKKATGILSISDTTQIYDRNYKSVSIATQPADLSIDVTYD